MSGSNDWLGGYSLEELLGATPVTKTKKQMRQESGKRGIVSATLGAPFRLIGGLLKLPITIVTKLLGGLGAAVGEVVKLPVRLVGALISPWRKK